METLLGCVAESWSAEALCRLIVESRKVNHQTARIDEAAPYSVWRGGPCPGWLGKVGIGNQGVDEEVGVQSNIR